MGESSERRAPVERRSDAHAFYTARGYRDRCKDHAQFIRQLGP